MHAEAIDALIAAIYEAAIDPLGWQRSVDLIVAELPGIKAVLWIRLTKSGRESYVHAGFPVGAMDEFASKFGQLAPWSQVLRDGKVAEPYALDDLGTQAAGAASKFQREWLAPNGIGGGFGVKISDAADYQVSVMLFCSLEMAATQRVSFMAVLGRLAPHLKRSVDLSRQHFVARDSSAHRGVLRVAQATAIVDGATAVQMMNPAMDRIVALGLCSLSPGRKLRLHRADDTARMAAIMLEAVKGRRSLPWPHVMAFEVPGRTGPNVLEIEPLAPTDEGASSGGDGHVLDIPGSQSFFIVRMRVRSLLGVPSIEHIRVGLSLTPKQSEAVWSLVHGESIEKQAQDRGVSVDGVRWHFKNIYQRTGCSSQAELVRLVVSLFEPART